MLFLVHSVRCDAEFGNHVVYFAWLGQSRFGADLARDIECLAGVTRPKKIRRIEKKATFGSVWLWSGLLSISVARQRYYCLGQSVDCV